jgi:hypothetical protein
MKVNSYSHKLVPIWPEGTRDFTKPPLPLVRQCTNCHKYVDFGDSPTPCNKNHENNK